MVSSSLGWQKAIIPAQQHCLFAVMPNLNRAKPWIVLVVLGLWCVRVPRQSIDAGSLYYLYMFVAV